MLHEGEELVFALPHGLEMLLVSGVLKGGHLLSIAPLARLQETQVSRAVAAAHQLPHLRLYVPQPILEDHSRIPQHALCLSPTAPACYTDCCQEATLAILGLWKFSKVGNPEARGLSLLSAFTLTTHACHR
jgi:hypothetical protein